MNVVPHRSTHACFPAIPFDLPDPQNFSHYTGVDPSRWRNESKHHRNEAGELDELDYYHDWCHTSAIERANATARHIARLFNIDLNKPSGKAFRRIIENPVAAVTSIENLGRAFTLPAGSQEKMVAVACAFTRLNAIIWLVCMVVVVAGVYLTCCWPCFNLASIFMYFFCCCGMLRAGRRRRDRIEARVERRADDKEDRREDDEEDDGEDNGEDDQKGNREANERDQVSAVGAQHRPPVEIHHKAARKLAMRYPVLPKEHTLVELWTDAEPRNSGGTSTRSEFVKKQEKKRRDGTLYGAPVQFSGASRV